jgi:hypothetical protein
VRVDVQAGRNAKMQRHGAGLAGGRGDDGRDYRPDGTEADAWLLPTPVGSCGGGPGAG